MNVNARKLVVRIEDQGWRRGEMRKDEGKGCPLSPCLPEFLEIGKSVVAAMVAEGRKRQCAMRV